MKNKLKVEPTENPQDTLEAWRKIPSDKTFLKKRVPLKCCGRKKPDRERARYGTSRCDGYALHYRLALIIANNLYQYIGDAKDRIVREDWQQIEKSADAIKDFAEADSWDSFSKDKQVKEAYLSKEKRFKDAMMFISENWNSFWW